MDATTSAKLQPKSMTLAGWALTGLFVLFMVFDISIKAIGVPIVRETSAGLGLPASTDGVIWPIELACLVLYLFPRTALFGAVAMTGYMGGAIAINLRAETPLFSNILFGVYLSVFMWGGLFLRDPRVRAVFPLLR
jgi:hypothetical protein